MEKTKLNLPLPLPLYRGIVAAGENAGKMIEGGALISIFLGSIVDISIIPPQRGIAGESIRPETLSMYIGKEDMNGKNIFTGYVLKYEGELDGEKFEEYFLTYWEQRICGFMLHSSCSDLPVDIDKYISECEVIGNIHENPELLKLFPNLQGVN